MPSTDTKKEDYLVALRNYLRAPHLIHIPDEIVEKFFLNDKYFLYHANFKQDYLLYHCSDLINKKSFTKDWEVYKQNTEEYGELLFIMVEGEVRTILVDVYDLIKRLQIKPELISIEQFLKHFSMPINLPHPNKAYEPIDFAADYILFRILSQLEEEHRSIYLPTIAFLLDLADYRTTEFSIRPEHERMHVDPIYFEQSNQFCLKCGHPLIGEGRFCDSKEYQKFLEDYKLTDVVVKHRELNERGDGSNLNIDEAEKIILKLIKKSIPQLNSKPKQAYDPSLSNSIVGLFNKEDFIQELICEEIIDTNAIAAADINYLPCYEGLNTEKLYEKIQEEIDDPLSSKCSYSKKAFLLQLRHIYKFLYNYADQLNKKIFLT